MIWMTLAACSIGVDGTTVIGAGSPTPELRTVDGFDAVRATGTVDVELEVREGPIEVIVMAPEGQHDSVHTEVVDGELRVGSGSGVFGRRVVVVRVPALTAARSTSAGDLDVTGLDGGSLVVELSGTGDASLAGTVDALTVTLSSAGDLDATELDGTRVVLTASGTGDARLAGAIEALDATLSSAGWVRADGVDGPVKAVVEGTGDLDVDGVVTALELRVTSAGDVDVDGIEAEAVQVTSAGTGDVTLAGATDALRVRLESAGDVDARRLSAGQASIRSEGTGDIDLQVSGRVTGELASAGDVNVRGGASTQVSTSGTGDVRVF